ncbi:MAG: DUF1214 domain-containing protein [Acidimicrobiales bacterium]|nr:DUF1214 domain-containing protein [Acidimicrobiales bacterium]MCB1015740.1 DUF1214 domain-containing protein [Acidimicrobiales bacterium]MCB9372469.1 DUF1214 domain-containing protein [Microthrixaceae bacterium]
MAERQFESGAAFHALLDLIRGADRSFLVGDRAVPDDVNVLEGYRWLIEVLGVGCDLYLWADPDRPEFVDIVSPTRKFGGDNADAFYSFATIDPRNTYRVTGHRGDAVYLSFTVYGGPDDGRWSDNIVGTVNDHQHLDVAGDGTFSFLLGPPDADPGDGTTFIALTPDANACVTRDYMEVPRRGERATYAIEVVRSGTGVTGPPAPLDDAELALRLRRTTNFLADLLAIFPIPMPAGGEANAVQEPYPVPAVTYGWAAGDASYAMGSYDLADDEVLIIEGRSPGCVFWNLCLWNPYLQTYDYRYEPVTINGTQVQYEPDGSWKLAVAAKDPGLPNWLSTAGHPRGVLWFRWFLVDELPERPTCRVVTA